MARRTVERNISFDDVRKVYYVSMDLGRDEKGARLKQYRTYPTLTAARTGLRDFLAHREQERQTPRHQLTLSDWLEYWMDTIVRPNRARPRYTPIRRLSTTIWVPPWGTRLC